MEIVAISEIEKPKLLPILNKRQFRFSAIVVGEVGEKLIDLELEYLLNGALQLVQYGQEISHIDFIFIAVPAKQDFYANNEFYSPKKQTLHLELALDYSRFAAASPEEAKLMMAELYLEAIKTYPKIRGMKKVAFNYEQFYTDVRNLFEKEGWLGAL